MAEGNSEVLQSEKYNKTRPDGKGGTDVFLFGKNNRPYYTHFGAKCAPHF
jgi:hypothetical protein